VLALLDPGHEVGDVLAQGRHARDRDLLADEISDQESQQRFALERREADRRARVVGERVQPLSVSV
jgi:hypothetical protein